MKAIKFKNFSTSDFSWKYDGIEYTFPAGSEIFLEDFKAHHFAKHLVDRELNAKNIPTNTVAARQPLEVQCFPPEAPVTPLEALNIEETKKRTPKKKVEKEFADLDNEK